ncbi:MAG TPA: hypothetical protein VKT28_15350 [Puia sp.]|nr:hypothetical protein [Puia sp.]
MKKNITLFLFPAIFLFGSCVESSYLFSPNNATSIPYHAIPLQSDSLKGANYVSSTFTLGGANQAWRDGVYAFQGRIHRSNNFSSFQSYYGANLTLGDYHVAQYNYSSVDYYPSNNFFGSYGFNGGINAVMPTRHGGEWRVIGIETSVQKEFGSYYNFRKNLPDSSADIIFRKNVTGTLGIFTNIIAKSRRGSQFGYKMSLGFMLNPESDYTHYYDRHTLVNPTIYFSHTIHFTKEKVTGFVQFNFSNNYAGNVQFGINYRLGKK